MATDGETPEQPQESDMLPDEAEVIAERMSDLEEFDDDEFLTVEEVAEYLGVDLE